jgi:hypothetical protein
LIYNDNDRLVCNHSLLQRNVSVSLKTATSNIGFRSQDSSTFAQIDGPTVDLKKNGEGFYLKFKVVNPSRKIPIEGTVAIIAKLKIPHKPQFVSFPKMELENDGLPVKLKKSLQFYRIRRFKYFIAEFNFPFSNTESFRILIYKKSGGLVCDYTISSLL